MVWNQYRKCYFQTGSGVFPYDISFSQEIRFSDWSDINLKFCRVSDNSWFTLDLCFKNLVILLMGFVNFVFGIFTRFWPNLLVVDSSLTTSSCKIYFQGKIRMFYVCTQCFNSLIVNVSYRSQIYADFQTSLRLQSRTACSDRSPLESFTTSLLFSSPRTF